MIFKHRENHEVQVKQYEYFKERMKKILKIPQAQVSKNDNIRSIQELRHFRKFFSSSWFQYKSWRAFWGLILVGFWKSLQLHRVDLMLRSWSARVHGVL